MVNENNRIQKIKCPNCEKAGTWTSENSYKPFCSARCKLIDLGEWASEGHRIKSVDVITQIEE